MFLPSAVYGALYTKKGVRCVHWSSAPPRVVRHERLGEQAYRIIRDAIVTGVLTPGEAVTELGLGERMGISRSPVREALTMLKAEGLVEMSQRGQLQVIRPRWEDFVEYLMCRKPLEELAASLAARRAEREAIAGMQDAIDAARACAAANDAPGLLRANTTFHETMRNAAGNRPLRQVLESLHGPLLVFRSAILRYSAEELPILQEHQDVLDAIAARDEAEAAERMRRHMDGDRQRGFFAMQRLQVGSSDPKEEMNA